MVFYIARVYNYVFNKFITSVYAQIILIREVLQQCRYTSTGIMLITPTMQEY